MPKAAKKSTCETQNLPPEDTDVPESQEESTSSDQEPDVEVYFHPSLVPLHFQCTKLFQACTCPLLKAQEWTGQ